MDLWIDNSNVDRALRLISKNVPDVFCISVYSTQYPYFKELVNRLKKTYPGIKIIAGGPGATFSYQVFLEKTPIDYCVMGEGEITLRELLSNINYSPEGIPGLAHREKGQVVLNVKREQIADIDTLTLPDRNFFDIERYINNGGKAGGRFGKPQRITQILAGRGCPYKCTFCSKTFSGVRLRSIDKIEEEIAVLKKEYNIDMLDFSDELVVVNKKRTLELCESLKRIGIQWGCQGRLNLVDDEILKSMKDAQCVYIGYGVESFSQKILDRMGKHVKVETIIPAIEMTKRIGMKPLIQYMYGFPGEDDSSIERTIDFYRAIDQPYGAFTTTPIPGTKLYEEAMQKGLIKNEEDFLLHLESGYNRNLPLVNMTEFSEKEFVEKRTAMIKKINRAYYGKHPLIFARQLLGRFTSIMKMFFSSPALFTAKVKSRLVKVLSK
jgi:radical SAM superfamily enzyme YgiQ (UPF0313 family)